MSTIVHAVEPALICKNLGNAHLAAGDFRAARARFAEAVRLQPKLVEARHNLGVAHFELGEFDQAAVHFLAVIAAEPGCGIAYYNLGNVRKAQGDLPQAIAAYEEALRLMPDRHQVAYNLGIALHEHGELERAKLCYRRVLALHPEHADASNNLATLLKEQGAFDQAVTQYRQTLSIRPDHALAFYNLSELAAAGRFQFRTADLDYIHACLASGAPGDVEKSLLHFTLATVHDQQGAYDEAFAHYQTANQFRHGLLKSQNAAFDAEQNDKLVEHVMEVFDRSYFETVRGWGLGTELPVFIIGMPRCGSTLVEQILASHPRVFGAGEIGEIPKFMKRAERADDVRLFTTPVPRTRGAVHEMGAAYLSLLERLGNGADRVTSKTLDNYFHLGIIATLFPRAHIIHCQRDPLDLCLSCYFQNFQDVPYAWSLADIGAYYRSYEKLMAHWANVLPIPIHEVRYEAMVRDQETVSRALLSCCGLDWDERCLSYFKNGRAVRTASSVKVRSAISTQAIGRWKNYRAHVEPLFRALGGYEEPVTMRPPVAGHHRGLSSMVLLPCSGPFDFGATGMSAIE